MLKLYSVEIFHIRLVPVPTSEILLERCVSQTEDDFEQRSKNRNKPKLQRSVMHPGMKLKFSKVRIYFDMEFIAYCRYKEPALNSGSRSSC